MIKTIDINLIFIDKKRNYEDRMGIFIKKNLFKNVVCFEDEAELNTFIESLAPDEYFLVFVHAFRKEEEFVSKLKSKIEAIYTLISNKLIVRVVTSDEVSKVKELYPDCDVFTYDQIITKSRENTFNIQKKSDLMEETVNDKNKSIKNLIFISHSSKDQLIIDLFFEKILRLGINIPKEDIFYTSDYESTLMTSDDIPDKLKKALNQMTLFIQFISENYKKSEICLNEMGASWIKLDRSKIVTFIIPPLKFKDVGTININKIGLKIDDKNSIYKLYSDYKDIFSVYNHTLPSFNGQVDKFIKELKGKL